MPEESPNIMAQRMKALRLDAKMTQEEVAKRIGVHKSTILRWENGIGTGKIKLPIVDTLAQLYGVSPMYLIGLTDSPVDFREGAGDEAFRTYMKALEAIAKDLDQDNRKRLLEMANLFKLGQDADQKEKPSEEG